VTRIETPSGWVFFNGSPIEEAFYEAWCRRIKDCNLPPHLFSLTPEYCIGRYRVDFAHVRTHTAIELVGQATHSTTAAIAYDCKRQREIEDMGWHVVRFGGREIFTDVEACVNEVGHLLIERMVSQKQVRTVRENTTPSIVRENTTPCEEKVRC